MGVTNVKEVGAGGIAIDIHLAGAVGSESNIAVGAGGRHEREGGRRDLKGAASGGELRRGFSNQDLTPLIHSNHGAFDGTDGTTEGETLESFGIKSIGNGGDLLAGIKNFGIDGNFEPNVLVFGKDGGIDSIATGITNLSVKNTISIGIDVTATSTIEFTAARIRGEEFKGHGGNPGNRGTGGVLKSTLEGELAVGSYRS